MSKHAGKQFELIAADNGGWLIYGPSTVQDRGLVIKPTAAFSSTSDMIRGLSVMLGDEPLSMVDMLRLSNPPSK